MLSRDLPYKSGLTWRNPSFLLWDDNEELYEDWLIKLTNAPDCSLFTVTFTLKGWTASDSDHFEPIMKTCGLWKTLGPGRRFTTQEILWLDDLTAIDFVRGRSS